MSSSYRAESLSIIWAIISKQEQRLAVGQDEGVLRLGALKLIRTASRTAVSMSSAVGRGLSRAVVLVLLTKAATV